MRQLTSRRFFVLVLGIFTAGCVMAQTEYVWTNTQSGVWSASENWADGSVATGETGRAWFTNAILENCAVNLDLSPWTVNSLVFSNNGACAFSLTNGTLNLGGTAPVITVSGGGTATVASVLSGEAGLIKTDTGTLVLCGSNTYSGATCISGGVVRLNSSNLPIPVRAWNADTLAGADGSTVSAWTDIVAGKTATVGSAAPKLAAGAVNGRNALRFEGGQNLIVSAADSPVSGAGAFTVSIVFQPAESGASGSTWYQNSGLVDAEQSGVTEDWGLEWNGNNQVAAGIGHPDTTKTSAVLSLGVAHVAIYSWDSTGLMTLNVDGTTVTQTSSATAARNANPFGIGKCLTSSAYFKGLIADIRFYDKVLSSSEMNDAGYALAQTYGVSSSYTFVPGHVPCLPAATSLSIASGAVLDLYGFDQTVQSLSGAGTIDTTVPGGLCTLTVNNESDAAFSGALNNSTGTLAFVKSGTGALTLAGNSACRGRTTVSQGTLVAANAAALGLPADTLSVSNGATLSVNAGEESKGLAWVYYASVSGAQSTFTNSLDVIQSVLSGVMPTRIATAASLAYTSNSAFPVVPADRSQAICSGLFRITTPGQYTFKRNLQDDDAAIFVDGTVLVPGVTMATNQPWAYPAQSASVALWAGYHSIVIPWYQGYGGAQLQVQWSGPDTGNSMVNFSTASAFLSPDLYVGALSGAGNVELTTGNLFAGCNNESALFSGVISGVGGLNKWGSGSLTLTGNNTYSGATTVIDGSLTITGDGQLGGGSYAGAIVNDGVLNFDSALSQTLSGDISGKGALIKDGAGTLTLSGAGAYSGSTTVNGGTLVLQASSLPVPVRDWNADSLTGDGSSVTVWTDLTAGKTATVLNTAPTLATNVMNGHNAVVFTGSLSNSLQVAASDSSVSGAGAFTIAVVFKPAAGGVGSAGSAWYQCSGLVDSELGGWQNDWGLEWNGANQVVAGIGISGSGDVTMSSSAFDLNTPHVAFYCWDGATGYLRLIVDGVTFLRSTAAVGARNSASFGIGRCLTWPTGFFTGQIADIRFYDTALTAAEVRRAGYALAQTYGITAASITAPAGLASTTALTMASGASLVLNEFGQTLTSLQGEGCVSGGVLTVTGSLAPGGTNSVGALSAADLILAENAAYEWDYDDSAQDRVIVSGTLTLPSVVTVNVSRVTGSTAKLPGTAVLFSFGTVVTDTDGVRNWVVTGGSSDTHVGVRGTDVLLLSMHGTLFMLQ